MAFLGNERFELRRELGRGGMGVVWEAYDVERQQPVALKMLHGSDASTISSMKQEFRSLSEISHPRLISMYELLCHEGAWFFTMEFIRDGRNLFQHIRGGDPAPAPASASAPTSASFVTSNAQTGETRSAGDEAATLAGEAPIEDAATSVDLNVAAAEATVAYAPAADLDATIAQLPESPETLSIPDAKLPPAPVRKLSETTLRGCIEAFRELAEGVHALHLQGKLHRDLKPANVLVRAEGGVVILDFGLVVQRRARTRSRSGSASVGGASGQSTTDGSVSGTIPYMAPEQAAGNPLTEASDWYSIGVMLYEALTGELPFVGDALTILRSKQRLEAPDLATRICGVPEPLRDLTMRLLRRKPELRPGGRQVLTLLNRLAGAEAAEDSLTADEGLLPEEPAFIGREGHLAALRAAFASSAAGPVIARVHGRSGSGKSALAQYFLDHIEDDAALETPLLLFRGRCYEQESVPYKTVDGVVDEVAIWLSQASATEQQELIPEDSGALAKIAPIFRRVPLIAERLGSAGATLPSGSVTDLAELRLQGLAAFGELLRRIGERTRLVLSIDDLQWGDADGVEMLRAVFAAGSKLLVLVTYRDEYLAASASLQALETLERTMPSVTVADIPVGPLDHAESLALLHRLLPDRLPEDALDDPHGEPSPSLGDLEAIVRQAEGNPYFLEELARHLRNGRPMPAAGSSGLDEILWSRIASLPRPELDVLETIAVSGQPIRLLYAQSAAGHHHLPPSGLTTLRMHHLVRSNGSGLYNEVETYHDRIRETVLAHLSREVRRDRHASLAVRLEASGEATPDTLAVHFESGEQPAKAGHFYELAAQEAAHALAFARAEEFYNKARRLSPDPAAQMRIVERLVHLYTDLARFPEAYALGRQALGDMGLAIPPKFVPPALVADLARNWVLMRRRSISSLVAHPLATDPAHIARMQMLATLGKAAFQIRPELCVAILFKMVNHCLRHGHVRDSSIGYVATGCIFYGGILGRYEDGYQFGLVALDLVERYEATRIRAEVNFVVGYFGTSWRQPAVKAERLFSIAHDAGLASGDLFHLGCASCATLMSLWMRGVSLDEISRRADEALEELTRFHLHEPRTVVFAIRNAIGVLRDGSTPQADTSSEALAAFGSRHFAHFAVLLRMQLEYLAGDYARAVETGKQSAAYLGDSNGMLHNTEHFFYLTLAQLALARSRPRGERSRVLRRASEAQRRFTRWATGSPVNFDARAILLAAEVQSTEGKHAQAVETFGKAIQTAIAHEQPHLAALAGLLAAEASRALSPNLHERQAQLMYTAAERFKFWGAVAYAERLEARLPQALLATDGFEQRKRTA